MTLCRILPVVKGLGKYIYRQMVGRRLTPFRNHLLLSDKCDMNRHAFETSVTLQLKFRYFSWPFSSQLKNKMVGEAHEVTDCRLWASHVTLWTIERNHNQCQPHFHKINTLKFSFLLFFRWTQVKQQHSARDSAQSYAHDTHLLQWRHLPLITVVGICKFDS